MILNLKTYGPFPATFIDLDMCAKNINAAAATGKYIYIMINSLPLSMAYLFAIVFLASQD